MWKFEEAKVERKSPFEALMFFSGESTVLSNGTASLDVYPVLKRFYDQETVKAKALVNYDEEDAARYVTGPFLDHAYKSATLVANLKANQCDNMAAKEWAWIRSHNQSTAEFDEMIYEFFKEKV